MSRLTNNGLYSTNSIMFIDELKRFKAEGDLLEKRGIPRTTGISKLLPIEKEQGKVLQTKLKIEEDHLKAIQQISIDLFDTPDHAGKIIQNAIKRDHDKLNITPRMPVEPLSYFVRRDLSAYQILKSNKNWVDVSAVTYSPWLVGFLDAWLEKYNNTN